MEDVFKALIEKARAKLGIDDLLTSIGGIAVVDNIQNDELVRLAKIKMDAEVALNLLAKLTMACEQQITETEARLGKRIDQVLEDEQHRVHEMLVEGLSKV